MNRADLRALAEERVRDAEALLAAGRWSGAYHIIGYALECALKCCNLKYLEETGMIFRDKKYLTNLGKCWTHDLVYLVQLADLETVFGVARKANPQLEVNWGVAKDWEEISRYTLKSEVEARELFEAVTNYPDGVLPWLQSRW